MLLYIVVICCCCILYLVTIIYARSHIYGQYKAMKAMAVHLPHGTVKMRCRDGGRLWETFLLGTIVSLSSLLSKELS